MDERYNEEKERHITVLPHYEVYPKFPGKIRLERELQMVQFSATWCSCIVIL
jgi:hypothetical protein